jgi:hypothetical protein
MRGLTRFSLALCLFSGLLSAATWTGTLMDSNCKGKDPATHTKQCAMSCAKSGFGLVGSDGKFIKFDEAGNAKALAALKATNKASDLKATVTGELKDGVIRVESVEIQ